MSEGEPISQEPGNVEENMETHEPANDKETTDIPGVMRARDSFKVYVSNLNNFMSQKEALQLFKDRNISGIKCSAFEFVYL